MSSMQFSEEFFASLQEVLEGNDPRCRDDGVAAQYLAAVIGFKLANAGLDSDRTTAIRDQLCGFIGQVQEDVEQQNRQQAEPVEEAFGIWRPEDSGEN